MAQEIADSTLLDTWASSGLTVEPDISKIIEGWQLGEQPPHEYMNWLQNTFGSKLNHILKNGVASWNNTTQYLAGSSVQHNGNVWLCKTTNTNSEPADVNANWKRIITVESLATVLAGYVATTQFTGSNQSLATNGYQKLPGGLIIQWGSFPVVLYSSIGTSHPVVFPVTFPNECFNALTDIDTTSPTAVSSSPLSLTASGFTAYASSNISGNTTLCWFAIGY